MSLINPPKESHQFVYHYTSRDTAVNHILPSGRLRFNPLSKVNDPREAKQWEPVVTVSSTQPMELDDWKKLEHKISAALRSGAKLACFSLDADTTMQMDDFNARSKRGYACAPMWHHYANRHDGVCLVFDRALLDAALRDELGTRLVCGPVEYSDDGWVPRLADDPFALNMISGDTEEDLQKGIEAHLGKQWRGLYFRKLTDWAHEREFRWVHFGNDSESHDVSFGTSLKGIVLGAAIPENCKMEFYGHCVRHEAACGELHWRNGQPSIQHYAEPYITHKYLTQAD